jgi:hypothetical protein
MQVMGVVIVAMITVGMMHTVDTVVVVMMALTGAIVILTEGPLLGDRGRFHLD